MSYEGRAGMAAFGEPLIPSGFSAEPYIDEHDYQKRLGFPSKLSTLASRPDLIIRPAMDEGGNLAQEIEIDQVDPLTRELLFLDEFGLKTPGISWAKEPFARAEDVDTVMYYAVNRVEGYDFGSELDEIPEHVAVSAYEATLSYYEASLNEGGEQRFWDLGLRQLKYGTVGSELHPQTYLVDVDRYMQAPSPLLSARHAIQATHDIRKLETVYDKEFPWLRKRGAPLVQRALGQATQKRSPSASQLRRLFSCLDEYLPYI